MRNPKANLGGGQFNIQPGPVGVMGTPPPGYQAPGVTTTTTPTSATTGPTGAAPGAKTMDDLNKVVKQLETNFQKIVEKFSTLEHNHKFSGEIGIQVNIGNKEAIVKEIKTGIEDVVKEHVRLAMSRKPDVDSTGNAGGGGGNGG